MSANEKREASNNMIKELSDNELSEVVGGSKIIDDLCPDCGKNTLRVTCASGHILKICSSCGYQDFS